MGGWEKMENEKIENKKNEKRYLDNFIK